MATTQALDDPQSILQEQSASQINNQSFQQIFDLNSSNQDVQSRTLWIGDLPVWWDENYVFNLFSGSEIQLVKIIKNKQTKQSEGYGFVTFQSVTIANYVYQTYNGKPMPGTQTPFKLNWAAYGVGKNNENDLSIFVGDLTSEVNDLQLESHFQRFFPSVKSAKVIVDSLTGRSKGFGFVKFGNQQERNQAMSEMGGQMIGGRPIRVSTAISRKNQNDPKSAGQYIGQNLNEQALLGQNLDQNNTTIFVGGLNNSISQEDLKQFFISFGEIVNIKIPPGKGIGFVQFNNHESAENAMVQMNGHIIGNAKVRTSWGRSAKQVKQQQQLQQQQLLGVQQYNLYNPYNSNKYSPQSAYLNQFGAFDQFNNLASNQNVQQQFNQDYYGNELPYSQQQISSNNPYFNQYGQGRNSQQLGTQQNAKNVVNNVSAVQNSLGNTNQVGDRQVLKHSFNNLNKINYNDRENEREINKQSINLNPNFMAQNMPSTFSRNLQQYPGV